MSDTMLLTGASGFLGMEVLVRLLERTDSDVIVLLRERGGESADERMAGVFCQLYDDVPPGFAGRVTSLAADMSVDGLGLSPAGYRDILRRATSIVHCAASITFDLTLEDALNVNAAGASRMLSLAVELAEQGRLRRIVHVSTAYVSGRHTGVFAEQDLDLDQSFRNTYEQSKAHAERILRSCGHDLPLVVVRPSIVVGDSRCGWTPTFNVIYWPLRALSRGLIDRVPANPDGIIDMVPIDYVADGILAFHERDDVGGTVHLVAGPDAVSNRELAELASRHFDLPSPTFAGDGVLPRVPEAELYLPYFDVEASFDDRRARRTLEPEGIRAPPIQSYFSTIVDYAQRAHWGKRPSTREAAHRATAEHHVDPGHDIATRDRRSLEPSV
jgi:thioester reductase-like protein